MLKPPRLNRISKRRYYSAELHERQRPGVLERLLIAGFGILIAGFLFLFLSLSPNLHNALSIPFYDISNRYFPSRIHADSPIIIDIDEQSLNAFGPWPWPRNQFARLLQKLQRQQPAAVAIDILFSGIDQSSPVQVQKQLAQQFGSHLPLDLIPEDQRDYDRILAKTLRLGPFVTSYYFDFKHPLDDCRPTASGVALVQPVIKGGENIGLLQPRGIQCNTQALVDPNIFAGFINGRPDNDGIYRRLPMLMDYRGRIYPNLALQTLAQALGNSSMALVAEHGGYVLRMGRYHLPLDYRGNLLLHFNNGGARFEHRSAADILNDKLKPEELKDRILLIGVSALGLKEYRPNPLDPLYTGVDFHATVIDNILHDDLLSYRLSEQHSELASVLIAGLTFSLLLAWSGPVAMTLVTLVGVLCALLLSTYLFQAQGIVISPLPAIITFFLIVISVSLFKYWREVRRTNQVVQQILLSQEATIEGFGAMAEYRDPETGGHIKRTQNYIRALAEHLRKQPGYTKTLDDITIDLLYKTAPLHDIGKIGIPDHILLKPGKLTDAEFTIMKQHARFGADVVEIVKKKTGETEFLRIAKEIILCHQEKWDGSGYPQGLQGEEIPLSARLMAVADVYDALISQRVYKAPYPHVTAVRMITKERGNHFDPDIVDAFIAIQEQFLEIALKYLDSEEQQRILFERDDLSAT